MPLTSSAYCTSSFRTALRNLSYGFFLIKRRVQGSVDVTSIVRCQNPKSLVRTPGWRKCSHLSITHLQCKTGLHSTAGRKVCTVHYELRNHIFLGSWCIWEFTTHFWTQVKELQTRSFSWDVYWDSKLKSSNSCHVTALPSATGYWPEMRKFLVKLG